MAIEDKNHLTFRIYLCDHPFSTLAKFSQKLISLTYVCVSGRNVSFSKNFVYVLYELSLFPPSIDMWRHDGYYYNDKVNFNYIFEILSRQYSKLEKLFLRVTGRCFDNATIEFYNWFQVLKFEKHESQQKKGMITEFRL